MFGSGREVRGLGLGFTNSVGTGGKRDMCLCLVAVVLGGASWARLWEGGLVLSLCLL